MEAVKISRSSKLGRYYNFICGVAGYDEIERWEDLNLCVFVRRLFWGTLLALCYYISICLYICGMAYSVGLINTRLYALQMGLSLLATYGWIGFAFLVLRVVAKRIKARQEKSRGNHSLLYAWLRAKKEKVCPVIVVDG